MKYLLDLNNHPPCILNDHLNAAGHLPSLSDHLPDLKVHPFVLSWTMINMSWLVVRFSGMITYLHELSWAVTKLSVLNDHLYLSCTVILTDMNYLTRTCKPTYAERFIIAVLLLLNDHLLVLQGWFIKYLSRRGKSALTCSERSIYWSL